jgi:Ca-activated chloride channel family protein
MGVGHDVNAHLLDKLAEITDGSSEYAEPGEELDAQIAALYDRLAHPVLTGVMVSFGGLATNSVYPAKLPVLFKGSEIMIAGRYRGGGPATFTVAGILGGHSVQYACQADLPLRAAGAANQFLPTLWASRKIGFLLQEIRLHGENQELIEEVVRLSKRFGIVTEYTEFLAMAPGDVTAEEAVRQARANIAAARSQQAGKWAVNQAFNDQQLQQRAVANREANTYRDRRGNLVSVDTVSQIGRQVFYLRDGQWVDAEDAGPRQTRVVKLFSPEYFALLRSQPAFAQSQQLGWAVSMNVGHERIVVEKDGQQKDEQLRRRIEVPEEPQQQLLNNVQQMQQVPQLRQLPLPQRQQRNRQP